MRALMTKIAGDLRRRRLQFVIVALIVALATGVGTLAIELMAESSAPYMQAFQQYQGAHLMVIYQRARVTPAQLAATQRLPNVTASAGPWQAAYVPLEYGTQKNTVLVIARADPCGPVDKLHIVAGRWAGRPGEIVLTRSFAQSIGVSVGSQLKAVISPYLPVMRVVGEVTDIDEADAANFNPQFAWVQPGAFAQLLSPDKQSSVVILYRFQHAATDAELQQDNQEIAAVVPPSAIGGTISYLAVQRIINLTNTLAMTFLLAFSVFALGAAALIIANVVSGAVLTSHRDIGIIKALGFTPGQVIATFVGQMLLAALIGCLVGVPLGVLGSRPLVDSSATALGVPASTSGNLIAPLLATLGGLFVVTLAAWLPALRAGMLRPVDAIAQHVSSSSRRSTHARSFTQRLHQIHLPRPLTLGVNDAFARPIRSLLTIVAIIIGVATLVFASGLHSTFQVITNNRALFDKADVTISRYSSYPDSTLMRTLNEQPETKQVVAYTFFELNVAGLSNPVTTIAMRGDSGSLGFPMLAGRWFQGPGEAVGGASFVHEAHLAVGDTFTVTSNGHQITLRLVGEYFDFTNFGRDIRLDWSSYLQLDPAAQPTSYLVNLQPGANARAYSQRIAATAPDYLDVATSASSNAATATINALNGVLAVLVVILMAIAVAGVFNTLLLNARERMRDTATLKAIGMTPGQIIAMVVASACVLGVIGGIIGIPTGVWLHQSLLSLMSSAAGEELPSQFAQQAFNPLVLPLLALAGIAVAIIGAVLPAWMAAHDSVVEILRTE